MADDIDVLAEILALLPRPTNEVRQVIHGSQDLWPPLNAHPAASRSFLVPTLVPLEAPRSGRAPQVILISAAAGVGKTWLARYLAQQTGNILVELGADLQVGANYFRGGLARAYRAHAWSVGTAISTGRLALIIDGLDEALVAATVPNFLSSLADLAELLTAADDQTRRATSLVLLGRPDSVEMAQGRLDSLGLDCAPYSICLFEEKDHARLIRELADSKYPTVDHRQFSAVVEEFLSLIRAALGDGPGERQSFLGYAPVLDAISAIGDTENLYAVQASLKATEDRREAWDFLAQVPRWLLGRECEKIVQASHQEDKELVGRLYAPAKQLEYLCQLDPTQVDIPRGATADGEQGARVRSLIGAQLTMHPFLKPLTPGGEFAPVVFARFANTVFRDYMAAWAIVQGSDDAMLSLLDALDRQVLGASPLLIRLLFTFAGASIQQPVAIDPSLMGAVIDSAAMDIGDEKFRRSISISGRLARQDAGVLELTFLENEMPLGFAEVSIPMTGNLQLGRTLARAQLHVPGITVESWAGPTFSFVGPVVVECERFVFGASSHYVRSNVGETVRIDAASVSGGYQDVPVAVGELQIYTDVTHFPWSRYVIGPFVPRDELSTEGMRAAADLHATMSRSRMIRLPGDLTPGLTTTQFRSTVHSSGSWISFLKDIDAFEFMTFGSAAEQGVVYTLRPEFHWIRMASLELAVKDSRFRELVSDFLLWRSSEEARGGAIGRKI